MQNPSTKKNGGGLGFLVENMLDDFNNDENSGDGDTKKKGTEWCEREKRYNEIKQTILDIYSKIRRRKCYNYYNCDAYMNYSKVKQQYRELLKLLYAETKNDETKHRAEWHIVMLYRLLAFTRDICDGCGEREPAYMQLFELARMDTDGACKALKTIIFSQVEKKPIGSWKDVKGLVSYMRRSMNMRDDRDMAAYLELTKFAIGLVNERVAKDVLAFYKDDDDKVDNNDNDNDDDEVSFVSKWIPRENKSKKYGNFYERLACDYFKDWIPKDRNANPVSYEKAIVKCKIHYRKLISTLNQYLETPQIKMCQQRWSDIAFSKTTRLTRDLQDRALLNLRSDDHRVKRRADDSDRVACAEKYKVWKCETMNRINGINTDLETHVRVSKYYSECSSAPLMFNRNAEWAAFASQEALKTKLSRVIPVLAGNSHKAVGLALAVAENATTGKTLILKDGEQFILHDLDASFVKNVKCLTNKAKWNCENNGLQISVYGHPLYKCLISALKLLIESDVEAKQTRDAGEAKFTVAIFTDDDASSFFNDYCISFREVLNEACKLYREFGYGLPNVVLWGMGSTVGRENDGDSHGEYKSVSYGGALTIRVGCKSMDICEYLGLYMKDKNNYTANHDESMGWNRRHAELKLKNDADCEEKKCAEEWETEWNALVERLYCGRYYDFENDFRNARYN